MSKSSWSVLIPFLIATWLVLGIITITTIGASGIYLIILAGLIILIIITPNHLKSKSTKNKNQISKYKINDENYDSKSEYYNHITVSENEDYSELEWEIKPEKIKDEQGTYQDDLINKIIKQRQKKAKTNFENDLKKENVYGLNARCKTCNYMWNIRQKHNIPAKCPKCAKATVNITWKDNKQNYYFLATYDN